MKVAEPLLRLTVGVVVERRKAASPWADFIWRPVAVLSGVPETAPWTRLASENDRTSFYAGPAEIALYRSETEGYRRNLQSDAPSVWVSLQATDGAEPPYEIAAVTLDPAEGEALTEPAQAIVDAVPMPEPLRDILTAFIAEHHVERAFEKRRRDRADPEALARRNPSGWRDP